MSKNIQSINIQFVLLNINIKQIKLYLIKYSRSPIQSVTRNFLIIITLCGVLLGNQSYKEYPVFNSISKVPVDIIDI